MPESIPPAVASADERGETYADFPAAKLDAGPNLPDTNGDRRRRRPPARAADWRGTFFVPAGVVDAIERQYANQRRRDARPGPFSFGSISGSDDCCHAPVCAAWAVKPALFALIHPRLASGCIRRSGCRMKQP